MSPPSMTAVMLYSEQPCRATSDAVARVSRWEEAVPQQTSLRYSLGQLRARPKLRSHGAEFQQSQIREQTREAGRARGL